MTILRQPDISDMGQIIARLRASIAPREAMQSSSAPPVYCAFGTAMALRVILNRGHLMPGDLAAIHAAVALLDKASAEGRL